MERHAGVDEHVAEQVGVDAATRGEGDGEDVVNIWLRGAWIILVRPGSEAASRAEDIERALENYPVLDEEAYCALECEEYLSGWDDYGASDFVDHVVTLHRMNHVVEDLLKDTDKFVLRGFYEQHARDLYHTEFSGVCIPVRAWRCTRRDLAAFLHQLRKGVTA